MQFLQLLTQSFTPEKEIGLVQSGQGLGSILYQNVWGLVTIFQGLLELLCPSYTVFANMLIPCVLDEKRQYLPFRKYFLAFRNFCGRKTSETVRHFGKKMSEVENCCIYVIYVHF